MPRRFGLVAMTALSCGSLSALSCTSTANIDDVSMALDGDGNRKRNVFFTDTTEIHCVIEAGVSRDGVTIDALIRETQRYDFDQRAFVPSDRVVAQAEDAPSRSDAPIKVDLALTKPQGQEQGPFPAGQFVCEARLDGDLGGTAAFNIAFPDCPTAEITPASTCEGFYEVGKVCPAFGASSTEPAPCTCTPDKGWTCP